MSYIQDSKHVYLKWINIGSHLYFVHTHLYHTVFVVRCSKKICFQVLFVSRSVVSMEPLKSILDQKSAILLIYSFWYLFFQLKFLTIYLTHIYPNYLDTGDPKELPSFSLLHFILTTFLSGMLDCVTVIQWASRFRPRFPIYWFNTTTPALNWDTKQLTKNNKTMIQTAKTVQQLGLALNPLITWIYWITESHRLRTKASLALPLQFL